MSQKPLRLLNIACFLQAQIFLLPVLLLFYQSNGLTVGDYFLFQGIASIVGLLLELPAGYLGDLFSKKSVLILSFSLYTLRLVLWLFFAHYGYWVILAGELLFVAYKAFFWGTSDGYMYEYLKRQNKQSRMIKRLGRMNFSISLGTACSSLLSAYCYHKVSDWSMAHYHQDYGFLVLILFELILNLSAILLVVRLPTIPAAAEIQKSFKSVCVRFFRVVWTSSRDHQICYHVLLAGMLEAATFVFVWSFQPMMKLLSIPVAVYGFVYFLNHFFRAAFSYRTGSLMRVISLSKLAIVSVTLFILGFLLSFLIIYVQPLSVGSNLVYFFFLSVVIGFQLAFSIANTSRLHHMITPDIRATVASYNKTIARLCTGIILIVLKFLVDGFSMQISLGVCLAIFMLSLFPLRRVCAISAKEGQGV